MTDRAAKGYLDGVLTGLRNGVAWGAAFGGLMLVAGVVFGDDVLRRRFGAGGGEIFVFHLVVGASLGPLVGLVLPHINSLTKARVLGWVVAFVVFITMSLYFMQRESLTTKLLIAAVAASLMGPQIGGDRWEVRKKDDQPNTKV